MKKYSKQTTEIWNIAVRCTDKAFETRVTQQYFVARDECYNTLVQQLSDRKDSQFKVAFVQYLVQYIQTSASKTYENNAWESFEKGLKEPESNVLKPLSTEESNALKQEMTSKKNIINPSSQQLDFSNYFLSHI